MTFEIMVHAMVTSPQIRLVLFLLLLMVALSACDSTSNEPIACPAIITPAIEVEVRHAETSAPEAEGAVVIATDGAYTDTLDAGKSVEYQGQLVLLSLAGANERPGTYDVVVKKQGFETWTRTGVEPEVGECGVQTEVLEADLIPVSTGNAGA